MMGNNKSNKTVTNVSSGKTIPRERSYRTTVFDSLTEGFQAFFNMPPISCHLSEFNKKK